MRGAVDAEPLQAWLAHVRSCVTQHAPDVLEAFEVSAGEAVFGRQYIAEDVACLQPGAAVLEVGAGAMLLSARTIAFAMFRPSSEKASQDFALGWETGADTSAFQLRATWTIEDVFNNFWAFRQTQVGGLSEPYERRPYEPALLLAVRRPGWRIEAGGKWLTSEVVNRN